VLCLYVFEVHNAAVLEKRGQRLQNPGDLLNRELRALFVRVKCSALLGEIVVNRLLDSLEGVRVEASTGAGEKPNGPLIDEFLGREFFAHAQFCERSVELEGRYGRVRMANKNACINREPQPKINRGGTRFEFLELGEAYRHSVLCLT
jgi:hypothetical protein